MKMNHFAKAFCCAALLVLPSLVVADQPALQRYLQDGQLATGVDAMQQVLQAKPDDPEATFSLGILQFFQAIETLGQEEYRYGLQGGIRRRFPMLRFPLPENGHPELLTYAKARATIQTFLDKLTTAESTLAKVKPSGIKLPLKIAQVRMDLNGDGSATEGESLASIMAAIGGAIQENNVAALEIAFDDGDVLWLRGYCHVLSAVCEVALAHDWRDQFERTAHLLYPNVDTPYKFLLDEGQGPQNLFDNNNFLDVIAIVHTINYEVSEPERMRRALEHLESVVSLSRDSWKLINAETDNDREWLPNSQQTAAFSATLRVTPEMQTQWLAFLDEFERILNGEKLVPFWRGVNGGSIFTAKVPVNPKLGINLRKVFTDPQRLDLVLWLQGRARSRFSKRVTSQTPTRGIKSRLPSVASSSCS